MPSGSPLLPRLLAASAWVLAAATTTALPLSVRVQQPPPAVDPVLYEGLTFRMVGPFRGGRVTAVTGIAERPHTFFFGGAGGGVWKTDDAGHHSHR